MRALTILALVASVLAAEDLGAGTGRELFTLPLECGAAALVSQGNHGTFSHAGRAQYAYDLDLPRGTPITAMADGTVTVARSMTMPGDRCWDGGDSSCFPFANLVVLAHADGTTTIVKHLDTVLVNEGERVKRGQRIGLSGSTGYSTGPHAHVMRQRACGQPDCESLPLTFVDVEGDGVPDTDEFVRASCAL